MATTASLTAYQPKGNYLTAHQSLTAYETKIEHAAEISALSSEISSKVIVDGQYAENIQLRNIGIEEYALMLKNGEVLSNCIYEVSSENFEAFGNRIIGVAEPEDDSDAATKGYVDSEIGKIDVSGQLTAYAKSNDLTAYAKSNDLTAYARKSTTLAGYGITDAATTSYVDAQIRNIDVSDQIDELSSNIIDDVTDLVGGNA